MELPQVADRRRSETVVWVVVLELLSLSGCAYHRNAETGIAGCASLERELSGHAEAEVLPRQAAPTGIAEPGPAAEEMTSNDAWNARPPWDATAGAALTTVL